MHVCPIVPIANLPDIVDFKYHMCLSHMCVESEEYMEFYRNLSASPDHYVILDNSVHEKKPLPTDHFIDLWSYIKPDEVVLPDCIRKSILTIEAHRECYSKMVKIGFHITNDDFNCMVVPQGEDEEAWKWCVSKLVIYSSVIGVPRFGWLKNNDRRPLVKWIKKNWPTWNIHLLGWNAGDTFNDWKGIDVRSTDTAKFASSILNGVDGGWHRREDFFYSHVDSNELKLYYGLLVC